MSVILEERVTLNNLSWEFYQSMLREIRRLICLHRHVQQATGPRYVPADKSLSFAQLSLAELGRFIEIGQSRGQSAAVREFREWLKSS